MEVSNVMDGKHDTIQDVLRKLRACPANGLVGSIFKLAADSIADMIEEAWKRERAEIEANALAIGGIVEASRKKHSGNAAAMREALVQIVALAKQDQPRFAIISTAETALAAPPRNCDATTEPYFDIAKRFKVENCDQFDNDWEDPRTQCTHNCVECVIKWMLAKKGANDGSK